MLSCEGYKMFYGSARVDPLPGTGWYENGTWLYKPEYDCWYVNGHSYPAVLIHDIREEPHPVFPREGTY